MKTEDLKLPITEQQVREQLDSIEEQRERIESILGLHEATEEEKKDIFVSAIKHLRRLQHEIDDIARTAAIEINKARWNYNHWMDQYSPFLRQYWHDHAKVNKEGEKTKNYKLIEAGGGVYFRGYPGNISLDKNRLAALLYELEEHNVGFKVKEDSPSFVLSDFIKVESVVNVTDPTKLIEACEAFGIDYSSYGIVVTPASPLQSMGVGSDRAWSPSKAKTDLTRALEGNLEETNEHTGD